MKIVLFMLLISAQTMACPINVRIDKNQTTYQLTDFNKFLKKLTLNRYVIRDTDFKYSVHIRLTKRSLYEEPDQNFAMVSMDVYDADRKLISHSSTQGIPSRNTNMAYALLQYQRALVDIVRELPKCD